MSVRVRVHAVLVGPSSLYTLWVPPRRGSLASGPLLLTGSQGDTRVAPAPALARQEFETFEARTTWQ
jgi:hypothetical protein